MDTAADTVTLPPAVVDPMDHLRKSLNAATVEEVKAIVRQELLGHNTWSRIELKKDEKIIKLPETPRHYLFGEILQCVENGLPAALIGPAGSGKSTVCEQVAEALVLPYYLQNAVTGTHELAGYKDAHGHYHTTSFRIAFEDGGLILVDEADTSDAGAFKWINTAVANGYAMFPDSASPIKRHKDFRIVIAANTFGNGADRVYVGANQLDASTLDRFVFFNFGYDEKLETTLTGNVLWSDRVQTIRKAAMAEKARIVISPRASLHGARLLAVGWTIDVVEERVIWKGMDVELKERIIARIETDKKDAMMKGQGWSEELLKKFKEAEKDKSKKKKAA